MFYCVYYCNQSYLLIIRFKLIKSSIVLSKDLINFKRKNRKRKFINHVERILKNKAFSPLSVLRIIHDVHESKNKLQTICVNISYCFKFFSCSEIIILYHKGNFICELQLNLN